MPNLLPRYAPRALALVTPEDDPDTEPFVWVGLFDVPVTMAATWPTPVVAARMALSRIGVPRIRVGSP